jgi:hypothetical protein
MQHAVEQVIFDLQCEQEQYSDVNPILHYHLTDGVDLTIIASLDDLSRHLDGEIEERSEPIVDGIIVKAYVDQDFECISIDHPETEYTILRVRSCADTTCQKALREYYL